MKLVAVYHKGRAPRDDFAPRRAAGRSSGRFAERVCRCCIPTALTRIPSFRLQPPPPPACPATASGSKFSCLKPIAPEEFVRRANAAMPDGMSVSDAFELPEGFGSLSAKLRAALYRVELSFEAPVSAERISQTLEAMLSGEIVVNKRTKSGVRPVDMRPYILEVSVEEVGDGKAVLRVLGKLQADGGLRVDAFVDALLERLDAQATYALHRMRMYFADDGFLPRLPSE